MNTCDTCKHRTGWRAAVTRLPGGYAIADCMRPDWPEWWKARNERPVVMPGAGTACQKYEQRETPNVGAKLETTAAPK